MNQLLKIFEKTIIVFLFFLARKYEMIITYILILGFYVIFRNLDRNDKNTSAYSVFNKNFKELPGTFGAGVPGLETQKKEAPNYI